MKFVTKMNERSIYMIFETFIVGFESWILHERKKPQNRRISFEINGFATFL